MRKLIMLVLAAAIGIGVYKVLEPKITAGKSESTLAADSVQNSEFITENLLNGKFISLLSDEQLEKIAEKVKNSDFLAEDGPLKSFLEEKGVTAERFCEDLKDRNTLEKLREQFTEYLADRYCRENGVSREEVSEEELKTYQKEKVSRIAQDLLGKLKETR